MATTTNYGWTTPDDTALVKDGASAIRTLGSSVDTTTKNLNPETTLGDIAYRSSTSNVNTRLGIGTAGQVLTVAAGVPSWGASGGMSLISTTTLTGASVTLSSIPQTYKNLQLVIRNFKPATDAGQFIARYNGDSGTRYKTRANSSVVSDTFSQTELYIGEGNDNSVATGLIILNIIDYANTTTWKSAITTSMTVNGTTTANYNYVNYALFYNQIDAISSIYLAPDTGNFTSGTALLYGVS